MGVGGERNLVSGFPPPRTRQSLADRLALAAIAAWVWLGIVVYQLVENLSVFGRQMEDAGTGFKKTMTEVGKTLGGVPVIDQRVNTGQAAQHSRRLCVFRVVFRIRRLLRGYPFFVVLIPRVG